jgi:hypothetical protein
MAQAAQQVKNPKFKRQYQPPTKKERRKEKFINHIKATHYLETKKSTGQRDYPMLEQNR